MRLTIFRKLILGFAAIVVLAIVLALFQLAKFQQALQLLDAIARNDNAIYATVAQVAESRAVLQSRREAAMNVAALADGTPDQRELMQLLEQYRAESRTASETLDQLVELGETLSRSALTPERRQGWGELSREVNTLDSLLGDIARLNEQLFDLLAAGRLQDAAALRQNLNRMSDDAERRLDGLAEMAGRLTEIGRANLRETMEDFTLSVIVAIVLVALIGALASFLIGRSVSGPLVRSIEMAKRIGGGDLTSEMTVRSRDELGELAAALNEMSRNLRQVATHTRGTAENMNSATAQIRASAQEQAAAVAEQLAAIEETTATLTEITQSGAHMSQRAEDVIGTATGGAAGASQGLSAVEDTVAVMTAIREQVETLAENIVMLSQRTQAIGDIILTVNTIAERSHLLALNASIEAAAAGEHGRSFSVVAAEIKKLADQAKEATAQVRTNLGDIQQGINASVMLTEEAAKRVASGRTQTDAAERTIRRMNESIQESVQAFQQIVAGINQHQIGLEQVMQALQNIRTASTQTAGTTRQFEGAATNLADLSESLVGAVRNYKV